jgi:Rv2525c-like, glycoside hydrolase-like domain
MNWTQSVWRGLLGCLLLGAILFNPFRNLIPTLSTKSDAVLTGTPSPTPPAPSPTPTVITPTLQSLFVPLVADNIGYSSIELNQAWIADGKGNRQNAFLSNSEMRFYSLGYSRVLTDSIHLSWDQAGPCGSNQVFSGTVQVNPGVWQAYLSSTAPDCIGVYTNTLQFTYQHYTDTLTDDFVVNPPSQVIVGAHQGFDRCNVPSASDMQTWWYDSPYYSINLYIGGSLSHCANQELNALWVQEISKQGWTLIPTWVGPQAPCTSFLDRISYDPQLSYQQGQAEANSAIEASSQIGLLGGSIIYYDVESYSIASKNPSCRDAMNSFLSGWTQRIHSAGYRAGAYGASCNSFITEWATISPTLDDIWIASWHLPPQYDPNATVWGALCLSDALWNNHQRLKQYAGDHIETWGGVSMPIDSDVIDGEVSFLPVTSTQTISNPVSTLPGTVLTIQGSQIREMQALKNGIGWFLSGNHLIWRDAEHSTWGQTALPLPANVKILALTFQNEVSGWLAAQDDDTGEITIYATAQSKDRWENISTLQPAAPASQAWFSFINDQTGWLALRLQSSSNFSLGQLFRTDDGGRSWVELPAPIAGKIEFTNSLNGWLLGGASGNELYSTEDGGQSWSKPVDGGQGNLLGKSGLSNLSPDAPAINFDNLPGTVLDVQFSDPTTGWALVQQSGCSGEKASAQADKNTIAAPFQCTIQQLIFETRDGGRTWAQLPL